MIYDLFYVSNNSIDETDWKQFCLRFPSAQKIENVKTFDDIKKKAFTKFFWVVWNDITVVNDFKFDYRVDKWDEEYIHVWLNGDHRDGVCLFPKTVDPLQKEFNHRFYFKKKEIDIVASNPKPLDIIFISYNEIEANANYEKLKLKFPNAKRIHGVKGIHQAHIEAAKISTTDLFWVVDADAEILDTFNFETDYFPHYDAGNRIEQHTTVSIWSSVNPINGLIYGYGGVKLLPKKLTLEVDQSSVDMTTSISKKIKVMNKVSNVTAFNTDEFNTWKSAFRECVKLSTKIIDSNYDQETDNRLLSWCIDGKDKPFGEYAIGGARAGKKYGTNNLSDPAALALINNFDWLKEQFDEWLKSNG